MAAGSIDILSYFLGRRYGEGLLLRWGKYLFLKEHHFEKSKKMLHGHPGKGIIGGRFHSITRAVVPFLAGSLQLPARLFIFYAIVGSFFWALVNLVVGYIFGQGFEVAGKYLGYIFVGAIVLVILVIYLYRFVEYFTKQNQSFLDRYHVYPLVANIISIAIFAKILQSVTIGTRILRLDSFFYQSLSHMQHPWLTQFFMIVTSIATPVNLLIVSLGLTLYFAIKHRWYYELLLPLAMAGGLVSGVAIKFLTQQLRPVWSLIAVNGYSFPSGHATLATIFFFLVTYFFYKKFTRSSVRYSYMILMTVLWALVCLSRLYLGVHWLSDVLAGIALGTFWVTFSMIALGILRARQYTEKDAKREE